MPTVFEEEGFAFRIWLNDHPPPHVHIEKAGALLVVIRGDGRSSAALREVYDMKVGDQRRALALVREHWQELITAWKEIHGE